MDGPYLLPAVVVVVVVVVVDDDDDDALDVVVVDDGDDDVIVVVDDGDGGHGDVKVGDWSRDDGFRFRSEDFADGLQSPPIFDEDSPTFWQILKLSFRRVKLLTTFSRKFEITFENFIALSYNLWDQYHAMRIV